MLRNRISRFSFSSSYFFRLPYRTLLPPSNTSFPLLSSRIRNNPRLRESTIVRFHSHPLSFFPYPSTSPSPYLYGNLPLFATPVPPSHPWFRAHFRRPKSCAVLTPWINFAPSTNHRRAIIALSLSRLSSILQREEREGRIRSSGEFFSWGGGGSETRRRASFRSSSKALLRRGGQRNREEEGISIATRIFFFFF